MNTPLARLAAALFLPAALAYGAAFETAPLAPALDLAATVPAFRASVISQIQLTSALSAQSAPSLAPLLSAAPSASDPYRAQAAQLVGALAAQPEALSASADSLRAAFGDQPVDMLQKTAARLSAGAAAHPALAAQLTNLRQNLNLADPSAMSDFSARLNAVFDGARAAGAAAEAPAVSGVSPEHGRPLVSLAKHGETPTMPPAELEAYVAAHTVVTPRGLTRVNFASGDYKPAYDAELRRLGVDMVVIQNPSRAELAQFGEDQGYHLKSEYERWVMPVRSVDEHLAALGKADSQRRFRKALASSDGVPFEVAPLTVEKYEQWYPIYEEEVVGKPGGKRNVGQDFARKLADKGALNGEWYGLFFYDKNDPTKMTGGAIMKAWPERGMFVLGYAAYRHELRDANPMTRVMAESSKLAQKLGYRVLSFGQDTNFFGYDYSLGLMMSKSGFLLTPYPEDQVTLMRVLDSGKIAALKNAKGQSSGYFFFGIPRDSPIVERYLASREAGDPKEAQDLLGSTHYFDGRVLPATETTVGRRYHGDDPDGLRTPTGIPVIDRPMLPDGRN